ncbi:MAG TPA: DNA primase [Clostridiales bacterium]|jgi:DNA primase catalytic core|nr:DNA primase [Clostridiales bacterium]
MSAYDEILSSSNIVNILEYYGLKVNRNKCTCPFHNDTHPSMMVNTSKGIAKCFACGSGGNVVSFIQKYETEINHNAISTVEAMQKAIDIQHLNIVLSQNNNIPLTEEQKKQKTLSNILKDAIIICENNLKTQNIDGEKILDYLKSRNLSEQIINNFHIGFNPTYNNITNNLLSKYNMKDLIEVGITKESKNDYIDIFSHRIMIPIFDQYGNPVGFGARVLGDAKPKYINTMATPLFNKSELLFNYHKAKSFARDYEMIVVEGYMDVISSNAMGFANTVGIMGTALTKEQIELLKKLKCEITLSLDNDDAGKNAMIRVIPELLNEGLEVNVLDISKLEGKYKDFGDLQVANIKKEDVYKTKISAFIFLLENQYLQNKELNVDNIYTIYKKMQRDGLIKNTKDILRFKEYVTNKTNFKLKEVEDIIMPKEVKQESRVERYKGLFFYYYIMDHLKKYAINHQDRILQKYLEANSISQEVIEETLNNENYLKDGENTIDISRYVNEYIYTSDDYIKFKNDKIFILENLLNNVKSFDQEGKVVNIKLSVEQKDIVLKQYAESFETSIKEYIENNPDEFEDLFIANNTSQFEKLFPKTYVETLKEQAVSRFKNENVMEAVRYGLAYPDNMKSAMTRQFVNNDKYKTLLVFNNNKNILGLTPENIIKETKEELERKPEKVQDDIQKTEVETAKNNKDMSIFIKLSGKEKESYKGIYLPIDSGTQVFIPKQLYRIDDGRLQILNSQSKSANMSEYAVDENTRTKKFMNRLTLDNFYHKYFNLYEISMEKEVIPSASY